jgi:hypothetical protein
MNHDTDPNNLLAPRSGERIEVRGDTVVFGVGRTLTLTLSLSERERGADHS